MSVRWSTALIAGLWVGTSREARQNIGVFTNSHPYFRDTRTGRGVNLFLRNGKARNPVNPFRAVLAVTGSIIGLDWLKGIFLSR